MKMNCQEKYKVICKSIHMSLCPDMFWRQFSKEYNK